MTNLVLVVDHDHIERRYISSLLAADGFSVTQVTRSLEGLIAATTATPSLIILAAGHGMAPEETRVPLDKLIRVFRRLTNSPVAVIGDADTADEVKSLVSGSDLFLSRGFTTSELLSRIRMLMRRVGQEFPSTEDLTRAGATSSAPYSQMAQAIAAILSERKSSNGRQVA